MTTITRPDAASRVERTTHIGQGAPRQDGPAKATGTARYTFDVQLPDLVHGRLVGATIPRGRVERVDASRALALPGVLLVLSAENQAPTPPRKEGDKPYVWFDREIRYDGQDVAFVVATSQALADEAAALLDIAYQRAPHVADLHAALLPDAIASGDGPNAVDPGGEGNDAAQYVRGDPDGALAAAPVSIHARYTLPDQAHNPLEALVTVAHWDGEQVTIYESTQYVAGVRRAIAGALGIAPEQVRVVAEHVGGGFGSKLGTRSQAPLAALAARMLQRPVRAQLTRDQMHRNARHRPATLHDIQLAAERDGALTAIRHETWSAGAHGSGYWESGAMTARFLYACPNVASRHWNVRLNREPPGAMRAPGEMQSQFALETALDELAHALGQDPIALRRRNDTTVHPVTGKPYSSKHLAECLARGAELIGWPDRAQPPGSRADGALRRGLGVAVAYYPLYMNRARATVRVAADGGVAVESAGVDLGTGTYTILAQVAADGLGADLGRVVVRLGDTDLPEAPLAGGSMLAASTAPAVYAAAREARAQLLAAAVAFPGSLFAGADPDDLDTAAGQVVHPDGRALAFDAVLAGAGLTEIAGTGLWRGMGEDQPKAMANFGAQFADVAVDVETGQVRVLRFVAVHDSGRVLNAQTYRSQLYGGIVMGISNALIEELRVDERRGRVVNAGLEQYHIATQADVGDITVEWIDAPDFAANPLGMKSVGEVGITGVAPAIGNAIFNATGVRLRDLPFTPRRVLSAMGA